MGEPFPPNLKVIGRYSLLRELRRERHSVSYAAIDPVMNRELIVKAVQLVRPGATSSAEDLERIEHAFVRQAQAAGRLHHPHIVTVFDAGRSHEYGFLVIERVAGRPLHELLARGLRPAFVQCASVAARICDALEYAHGQGVAHRHLGPQHVFLLADGAPKVAGFGGWIDSGVSGDEALAHTDAMLPYFDNHITAQVRRADACAAASLLYMMLTGRAPSSGGATAVHTASSGVARPLPVQWLRADTPAELARIIDGALDPASNALVTPGALRDALTAFVWTQRTEDVAPATIGIPLGAPPRTQAAALATAAAAGPGAAVHAHAASDDLTVIVPRTPPAATVPAAVLRDLHALAPVASFTVPLTPPPVAQPGTAAYRAATAAAKPAPPAVTGTAATPAPWQRVRVPGVDPARLEALGRRVERNRFSLVAFGMVLVAAIVLGLMLGSFGRRGAAPGATGRPGTTALTAATGADTPEAARAAPSVSLTGVVQFDVAPWGEVLIDNKPTGVAPPLTQLNVPIGRHLVEIRHPDRPSWSGQVEVDAARPLMIRHHFD